MSLSQRLRTYANDHGASEGVLLESLPAKTRAALYASRPRRAAAYLQARFKVNNPLPGDVFEDFQRDVVYVVAAVKRDHLEVLPVSGQFVRCGLPPTGTPVAVVERVSGPDARWMPVGVDVAERARALAAVSGRFA